METAALIISALSFMVVANLLYYEIDRDDLTKLENKINELKSANKLIYKPLAEEYRDLTKTTMYPDENYDGVEFYASGMNKEFIRYIDLESKIAEIKSLKSRLCDNTCDKSPECEYTVYSPDSVSIDDLQSQFAEVLKNYEEPKKKKPRKKK